jgi:agmatinase
MTESSPIGPPNATEVPRFAGPDTFARLPRMDEVSSAAVAILGVPFDSGVSYRPGARFGPGGIRAGSKLLRPYHPYLDTEPWGVHQVADAGDVACNPFDILEAITQVEVAARHALSRADRLITIGGDHTIALPGVLVLDSSAHVGIRGPLYARSDLADDQQLGFATISTVDVAKRGVDEAIDRVRDRVGDHPVYVSIDIDVLDPSHAPGTGTPEPGGLTTREVQLILRGFDGLNIVGADVVEVAPAYDHAELTTIAAANLVYEFLGLFALKAAG